MFLPKLLKLCFFLLVAFSLFNVGKELNQKRVERNLARAQILLSDEGSDCSGTYVGPHTILTAEHCFTDHVKIHQSFSADVNGEEIVVNGQKAFISHVVGDGHDHILLTVDVVSPYYLSIDPTNHIRRGDVNIVESHPGGRVPTQEEELRALEPEVARGGAAYRWDASMFPGCSGAAFVNWKSKIVGVLSMSSDEGYSLSFLFNFSADQLKTIK